MPFFKFRNHIWYASLRILIAFGVFLFQLESRGRQRQEVLQNSVPHSDGVKELRIQSNEAIDVEKDLDEDLKSSQDSEEQLTKEDQLQSALEEEKTSDSFRHSSKNIKSNKRSMEAHKDQKKDKNSSELLINSTGIVEIEPTYLIRKTSGYGFELAPYSKRRPDWGKQISFGFSLYRPKDYNVDLGLGNFEEIYDGGKANLIEILFLFKRNLSLGSIGLEIGGGYYKAQSYPDYPDLTLELIPIKLGARLEIRTWSEEPYLVPYLTAGGYLHFFKEKQDSSIFSGNTLIAPYFSLGLQLQLNWLDRLNSEVAFRESGLENTYFFIEGKYYSDSNELRDPNFKSEFHPGMGMSLEF